MEPVIAAASPLAPALVRLPALPTRAALNRNSDGSTLYIGVSDYAVYAAPTLRRPNITPPQHYAAPSVAVTIEDRASPSFGEVTSSLNRNGDGSILYIGSVSVCVRRPTNIVRARRPN